MEYIELQELAQLAVEQYIEEESLELSEEQVAALVDDLVAEESQDEKLERIYQKLRRDPRAKKARDAKRASKKEKKMYTEAELEEHLIAILGEEEYMQLDEISKKTLGSYIGKATQAYANASVDKARHERDGTEIGRMDHNAPQHVKAAIRTAQDASHKAQYDADAKRMKRGRGVLRAVGKLTKESIEEMIAAAHESTPVEFAAAFASAMSAKISDRIEAQRPEVAASLFGAKE